MCVGNFLGSVSNSSQRFAVFLFCCQDIIAHLSKLVSELECLDKPQGLIHIAAHREVIDGDLPQSAIRVDDEEAAEGDTVILLEDPIGPTDGHVLVSQERYLHSAQTSHLPLSLAPGQVGELAVSGAGDHSSVDGLKLPGAVIEGDDLSGADEGEVQGVEEEDHILALVVIQADLFELTLDDSCSLELRGGHSRLKSHLWSLKWNSKLV